MVGSLAAKGKREKPLEEGHSKEGLTDEEHNKILEILDPKKPEELQKRVFLHCGLFFFHFMK